MLPFMITRIQKHRCHLKFQYEPETGLIQPHWKRAAILLKQYKQFWNLLCSSGGDSVASYILLRMLTLKNLVDLAYIKFILKIVGGKQLLEVVCCSPHQLLKKGKLYNQILYGCYPDLIEVSISKTKIYDRIIFNIKFPQMRYRVVLTTFL